jgi:hypothetical protein
LRIVRLSGSNERPQGAVVQGASKVMKRVIDDGLAARAESVRIVQADVDE